VTAFALASLCWFFALHVILCAVLAVRVLPGQEIWFLLDALLKPSAVLAGAVVVLLTHLFGPQRRWHNLAAGLVGLALLLVVPGMTPGHAALAFLPFLLVFLAGSRLMRRPRPLPMARVGLWTLLGLAATAAVGCWTMRVEPTAPNRFGLVASEANSTWRYDFSRAANKDHYPLCTFVHNSLGYRDIEPGGLPSGRTRILLVGDSFIWGDGIATAADTLGALLRVRLEALAPGRFEVVSAGFPGNGLYGYTRAIEQLLVPLRPQFAIVGYLGQPDLNPVDAQALTDALPRASWPRTLMLRMHAGQHLHEWSVATADELMQTPASQSGFEQLFKRLTAAGRSQGTQIALLSYAGREGVPHGSFALPSGIEAIDVPEALRYHGKSTDLWYAKDSHPKPLLNHKLADLLAQWLLARPAT